MKFIRLVWLDIKNGYVKQPLFYIFPLFIVGMGFADSYRQVSVWETKSALGDYWLYLYGGMKEYVPTLGNPFQFPAIWIMVFLMSSFLVMSYPMRDLQSTGTQMLVHAQGRSKWWISKCFWNLFSTFSYHITVLLLIVLLCIFVDVPITWEIHQKTIISMFSLGIEDFQGASCIL